MAGSIIMGSFTSRHFTQFLINLTAHYNDGPCGSTKSYAVADAEPFTGLGALRNRCLTCLRTGEWYDNRLVDKSRMNREVHVRFWEGPVVNWTWIESCDTTIGNEWQTGNTNCILNPRDPGLLAVSARRSLV